PRGLTCHYPDLFRTWSPRHGNAVEVTCDDDLPVEYLRRLVVERLRIGIALGEMREHEGAYRALGRHARRLSGREMPVFLGQFRFRGQERGFDHQQVRLLREGEHVVAQAGVHHEREALPCTEYA